MIREIVPDERVVLDFAFQGPHVDMREEPALRVVARSDVRFAMMV